MWLPNLIYRLIIACSIVAYLDSPLFGNLAPCTGSRYYQVDSQTNAYVLIRSNLCCHRHTTFDGLAVRLRMKGECLDGQPTPAIKVLFKAD